MADMDVSLDEILADHKGERRIKNNGNRRNNDRSDYHDRDGSERGRARRDRGRRDDYPRDGVQKTYRNESRKIDEEWVHDRYDNDDADSRARVSRGQVPSEQRSGTRIRVDNLHYELTHDDLEGLFSRMGPVTSVELVYDRAGRSDGIAFIVYEYHEDARAAVREFDGANAKGQPIRLSFVPTGGRQRGAKGGVSIGGGRPLADRISQPRKGGDTDGQDENGRTSVSAAARQGIDRYVPEGTGSDRLSRSRSPGPRRRGHGGGGGGGGRRPGERRGARNGQKNGGRDDANNNGGGNRRPRKTQEELDAEMADYFVDNSNSAETQADTAAVAAPAVVPTAAPANDDGDEDMIL
ncbi:hypothetical protein SEPCBS119000_002455 [Sporothrix epigloea]|uniref:RRM domain-containing protein n=1 Tax=Sporothrix epigloea TaxID=1892477 RepID=A0ABP0DGA3_9PEZI